jgi:ADP-heptose:LPS heptosyltransferase
MAFWIRVQYRLSAWLQQLKAIKAETKLKASLQQDLPFIANLPLSTSEKQGTLIVKCDDIGDFLAWQQVIPLLKDHAPKPLVLVANAAIKSLYEQYFDFADEVVWVKKSQWGDPSYRHSLYERVRSFNASMAMTPLFTRNFVLDDMLVLASGATSTYAWHRQHHAYFPGMDLLDTVFANQIHSQTPIKMEYFRNIEFVSKVFKIQVPEQFNVLFPNFKKYNTLIVVPVASAKSKTWAAENFARTISAVLDDFDKCIILGGANGIAAAEDICRLVASPKLINLVDQTQLYESFAFIGESRVLLTLDTFASHIGVLTATDTVLISNGTNWQRFANYAPYVTSKFISLMPPHFTPRPDQVKIRYSSAEINTIRVETVVKAIKQLKA